MLRNAAGFAVRLDAGCHVNLCPGQVSLARWYLCLTHPACLLGSAARLIDMLANADMLVDEVTCHSVPATWQCGCACIAVSGG